MERWSLALLLFACVSACAPKESDAEEADEESALENGAPNTNGSGDRYQNFAELSAHEKEGVDYTVTVEERPSPILALAIHGGRIEGTTSELARDIASAGDAKLYLFEGIKPSGNTDLHITSRRFDEPRGLSIAALRMARIIWSRLPMSPLTAFTPVASSCAAS